MGWLKKVSPIGIESTHQAQISSEEFKEGARREIADIEMKIRIYEKRADMYNTQLDRKGE